MAPLTDQQQAFIDDLLATHKSIFGDARMEDPEGQEPSGTEGGEEDGEPKPDEGGTEGGGEGNEPKTPTEDDLPDWAKKELKKARGEAANYRTKLREAEDSLSKAKTPEEYEAAVGQLQEVNARLEREVLVSKVARQFELPDELAELLKGDDEAALKAHAKTLQKFAPASEPDPELSGGLDPSGETDDGKSDPRALAKKHGARRY